MKATTLFDSQHSADPSDWSVIDDEVMGGCSQGKIEFTKEGFVKFSGTISLENNGGFSSIRYKIPKTKVHPENAVRFHLKGDGNIYQFRVKHSLSDYYSYTTPLKTNGEWQTFAVNLSEMYPQFRGKRLEVPNFNGTSIVEIGFLIGNKREQKFCLVLDRIDYVR